MKQKMNRTLYCKKQDKAITFKDCSSCRYKEWEKVSIEEKKTTKRKHKLTKATEIPKKIKMIVWERDNHKCIFCGKEVPWNLANSHYVKRSQLGLGIDERNIMTNCERCHKLYEESAYREKMKEYAKKYLMSKYDNWNEEKLIYKKYNL